MFQMLLMFFVITLVALVVAFFLSRVIFKALMVISTILFAIILIVGILAVLDAQRFSQEADPIKVTWNETGVSFIQYMNGSDAQNASIELIFLALDHPLREGYFSSDPYVAFSDHEDMDINVLRSQVSLEELNVFYTKRMVADTIGDGSGLVAGLRDGSIVLGQDRLFVKVIQLIPDSLFDAMEVTHGEFAQPLSEEGELGP